MFSLEHHKRHVWKSGTLEIEMPNWKLCGIHTETAGEKIPISEIICYPRRCGEVVREFGQSRIPRTPINIKRIIRKFRPAGIFARTFQNARSEIGNSRNRNIAFGNYVADTRRQMGKSYNFGNHGLSAGGPKRSGESGNRVLPRPSITIKRRIRKF